MTPLDDVALSAEGWLTPTSVALLLLATAKGGQRPLGLPFLEKLLAPYLVGTPLRAEPLITVALEQLEVQFKAEGGLTGVMKVLQEHCGRLARLLDEATRRQVVEDMVRVAEAASRSDAETRRLYAFPYAAARVWRLDDLARSISERRGTA